MNRLILMIIGAVIMTGGGAAAYFGPDQYRSYKAKAAVRQLLRDPESAVFTEVTVSDKAVCGMVNSRNGFGAMAGAAPFVVNAEGVADIAPVHLFHSDDELRQARERYADAGRFGYEAGQAAWRAYQEKLLEQLKLEDWEREAAALCGEPARG